MFSILGNMTDRRDYPLGLFYIDKSHINPFYDLFVRLTVLTLEKA